VRATAVVVVAMEEAEVMVEAGVVEPPGACATTSRRAHALVEAAAVSATETLPVARRVAMMLAAALVEAVEEVEEAGLVVLAMTSKLDDALAEAAAASATEMTPPLAVTAAMLVAFGPSAPLVDVEHAMTSKLESALAEAAAASATEMMPPAAVAVKPGPRGLVAHAMTSKPDDALGEPRAASAMEMLGMAGMTPHRRVETSTDFVLIQFLLRRHWSFIRCV